MAASTSSNRVVVYGYSSSPFFQKITYLLSHYGVSWTLVEVPPMPPRPALSELLGITYRRIPIVFIDGHAYIDTTAAAVALEKTFGDSSGKSLFTTLPALQLQLAVSWAESTIFRLGAAHLFNAPLDAKFITDRTSFMNGTSFDPAKMKANVPFTRSQLVGHLQSIEQHLSASNVGTFLLAKEPQYLDIALFTPLNWVQTQLRSGEDLLPTVRRDAAKQDWSKYPFPRTLTWLAAVRAHIASQNVAPAKGNAEETARAIQDQAARSTFQGKVDAQDPLVKGGWLNGQKGQIVAVTPTDTGRVPQVGALEGLDHSSITVRVKNPKASQDVLATFPRLNFDLRAVDTAKL